MTRPTVTARITGIASPGQIFQEPCGARSSPYRRHPVGTREPDLRPRATWPAAWSPERAVFPPGLSLPPHPWRCSVCWAGRHPKRRDSGWECIGDPDPAPRPMAVGWREPSVFFLALCTNHRGNEYYVGLAHQKNRRCSSPLFLPLAGRGSRRQRDGDLARFLQCPNRQQPVPASLYPLHRRSNKITPRLTTSSRTNGDSRDSRAYSSGVYTRRSIFPNGAMRL